MMQKKYEACIFDLDGVLVNTAKYHFLAWKRLSEELNIDFTQEDNERLKGVSRMDSLDIILGLGNKKLSMDEKMILADKKNNWYRSYIVKMDESEILPGAIKLLNILKEKGMKIGLGSASKNAPVILNVTGLDEYFDIVIDGNSVERAKPDPEVFLKGAAELGVDSSRCIVFEDAIAGIQAAKRAGMLAIGVGKKEILNMADYVVEDLIDFPIELIY
ncbi:MAG TPA: beta-phosphoglucomutase [Clostridia bacterium]|nr:beta-phosphoglucomutase [Clostridia bacterium]